MLYYITYIILRCFDGASVAVVFDNGNILAVVVDFALLGDHGKFGGATIAGSGVNGMVLICAILRNYFAPLPVVSGS